MEQEARMNDLVKSLDLSGWTVLWEPDPTQHSRGQILPEAKTIIIYDEEPEAAMETLLHEALEIKLRPMLKPYRTLVNALIEWANGQVYEAKEKVIEDILPFLIKFNTHDEGVDGIRYSIEDLKHRIDGVQRVLTGLRTRKEASEQGRGGLGNGTGATS